MGRGPVIRIAQWKKFQHYHKPAPRWIKLYRDLVNDYEIMHRLKPVERWILVGLWCLAAETDNAIPLDLDYLRQRLQCAVTMEVLQKLEGLELLELPAPTHGQSRLALVSEEKRRGEKSREEKKDVALFEVFEYWEARRKEVMGGRAKMTRTDKRLGKIRARLKEGYSVDDLKGAVDGCLATRFNVQRNFVDIELICRDQEHVERYLATNRSSADGRLDHLA